MNTRYRHTVSLALAFLLVLVKTCLAQGVERAATRVDELDASMQATALEEVLPEDYPVWMRVLEPEDTLRRWRLAEPLMKELISARIDEGDAPGAVEAALRLLNNRKRLRVEDSEEGLFALLEAARALVAGCGVVGDDGLVGGARWYPDFGAALADGLAEEDCLPSSEVAMKIIHWLEAGHPNSPLSALCRERIAEAIENPRRTGEAALLYELARSLYDERRLGEALVAWKQLLARLQSSDSGTRRRYAPRTHYYLGRTYQKLGWLPEACMTFREACIRWRGDQEYDTFNETGFYRTADELRRLAPLDPLLGALREEALARATRIPGETLWHTQLRSAEEARLVRKDYVDALRRYSEIPPDALLYNTAMILTGVCEYELGQPEQALGLLRPRLTNRLFTTFEEKEEVIYCREMRLRAVATGDLYLGLISYDRRCYMAVIELLWDFDLAHPGHPDLAARALRLVGSPLVRTGHISDGQRYFELASRIASAKVRDE